ncbi:hypothetical protein KP509_33G037700 [Ceratopteris richardii]|uniref:Uncharacterized protein n=1 Tax=Ceratopteris richardii TaxID=49495 RepID=A0A8T2QNQ7_CERRI|nr:hypothetical protein KP509_33G037700 [Ceratopteris richardii]
MVCTPSLVVVLTCLLSAAVVFSISPAVQARSFKTDSSGSDSVIPQHSQPINEEVIHTATSSPVPRPISATLTHLHRRMLPRVPVPPSAPSTGHNSVNITGGNV